MKQYLKLSSGSEITIGHPHDDARTLSIGGVTVKLTKEEARLLAWKLQCDADGVYRSDGCTIRMVSLMETLSEPLPSESLADMYDRLRAAFSPDTPDLSGIIEGDEE